MSADPNDFVESMREHGYLRGHDALVQSVSLGGDDQARLAKLEAMERRAHGVLSRLNRTTSAHEVAREILGESS